MPTLVSVVLPTYNRAETLGRSIDSVLRQTYRHLELIVVDDGSADRTTEVVAQYEGDSRMRTIVQPHSGCAAARNIGVAAATGRYVAFQDSDDEWLPNKVEAAVAALDSTGPETGMVYSDMLSVTPAGEMSYFHSPDIERGVLVDPASLDYYVYKIGIQSAVIRRECFDAVGAFDERLPRLIDLELFIRLSGRYDFVHQHEPLVRFYDGGGISTNAQALIAARTLLLSRYRQQLNEKNEYVAMQYCRIAAATLEDGDPVAAHRLVSGALRMAGHDARIQHEALLVLSSNPSQHEVTAAPEHA